MIKHHAFGERIARHSGGVRLGDSFPGGLVAVGRVIPILAITVWRSPFGDHRLAITVWRHRSERDHVAITGDHRSRIDRRGDLDTDRVVAIGQRIDMS
jgi:hypothetical protein